MCCRCFRLLSLAALFLAALASAPIPAAEPERPRLVVLVYFDQLRGDYLERWQTLFGEGGFRRLQTEGAWFKNCHYPYAVTTTGPGHASVATGGSPERHGIINNSWYDRSIGDVVYCAGYPRYVRVPPEPPAPAAPPTTAEKEEKEERGGGNPERLLLPTLGDQLKAATSGKSRVVSLSLKDRSAALPGGRRPDACVWFDPTLPGFVTSTYYGDRLPRWVEEHNRTRPADGWYGKSWDRLRLDLDYARLSGPDEVLGEGKGTGQGRTFPHPLNGGKKAIGKEYYNAIYNSPFGNDVLLGLVKRALVAEELGKDEVVDFLAISFSSNDPVGHCWGPDSQEVLDVTLRSDGILRELLDALDAHVGKGRYVLALTADHGVCPLPEVSRARGIEAARVPPTPLVAEAEEFLEGQYGMEGVATGRWIERVAPPWVYLNPKAIRRRELRQADVEAGLAEWLREQPGIGAAYTRSQLERGVPADDTMGHRVRRSYHADRAGDVLLVLKPYHLLSAPLATGTSHGTPHPYDTHVPLLVYGPGVRPGTRGEAVTPLCVPAVLAEAAGVKLELPPESRTPEGLLAR